MSCVSFSQRAKTTKVLSGQTVSLFSKLAGISIKISSKLKLEIFLVMSHERAFNDSTPEEV